MRPTLSTAQFQTLAGSIAEYSGFLMDGSRHRSLESAIAVRMETLGLDETHTYLQQIDAAELHRLTELVVNHETQFFRTPAHHRALREHILPALHRERTAAMPLRCWSAGCATGEEPYSLAISILQTLGEPLPRQVEIHATDISTQALAKAQLGRYRGRTLMNVKQEEFTRYFTPDQGYHLVRPEVRALIHFEQHNLHTPVPKWARALDIIFCQNVTIYFSVDVCRALMARFFEVLRPGGYLFLGFSETLWRIFDRFETVELAGAFVYRKPLPRTGALRARHQHQLRERTERAAARESQKLLREQPAPFEAPPRERTPQREARPRTAARLPSRPPAPTSQAFLDQGLAHLQAGQLDDALHTLRRVRADEPAYPHALAAIARIHANRGDWEQAATEAQRAIECDVLVHDAHLLLGMLYANQERWDEAVIHLERVRYLLPQAPLPSFHLANAYRSQQRLDLAEREYRSALRKLADLDEAEVLDGVTVAWLRETCQRFLQHLEADRFQHR
ncbi:MAG TPA: CheR family methyltransferase [Herpetosiphonaceae bacterium]